MHYHTKNFVRIHPSGSTPILIFGSFKSHKLKCGKINNFFCLVIRFTGTHNYNPTKYFSTFPKPVISKRNYTKSSLDI